MDEEWQKRSCDTIQLESWMKNKVKGSSFSKFRELIVAQYFWIEKDKLQNEEL